MLNDYDRHLRELLDTKRSFNGHNSSDRAIITNATCAFACKVLNEPNPSRQRRDAALAAMDALLESRFIVAASRVIEANRVTSDDIGEAGILAAEAKIGELNDRERRIARAAAETVAGPLMTAIVRIADPTDGCHHGAAGPWQQVAQEVLGFTVTDGSDWFEGNRRLTVAEMIARARRVEQR